MTSNRISNAGSQWPRLHSGAPLEANKFDLSANGYSNSNIPFRNVITNGNMQVAQRLFYQLSDWTTAGAKEYSADRWAHRFQANCSVSLSGLNVTPLTDYKSLYWRGIASGSCTYLEMGQQIEFGDCGHLQNQTVTISFWAKAISNTTASKTLTVRTRTSATENDPILFTGTASDNTVNLTTDWARYTVTKALPSTFGALTLEFSLSNLSLDDGFHITGIQMELGSYASDFEYRSWWTEYKMCRRFFQLYTSATATNKKYGFAVVNVAGVRVYMTRYFTETFWSRPTTFGRNSLSLWVPTVGSFTFIAEGLIGSTTKNATVYFTPSTTTGLVTGYTGIIDSNGSTSSYMWFGADF